MDWIEKMNDAIKYIEENLDGEIDYIDIARIAGCSSYHFQRVFSYMAGVSLTEYIRRRRLTMAAFDLQNGNEKVIDVGLKYGYSSPTSFTRAFQSLHGIAPSKAKDNNSTFTSYSPISFQITIKGVSEMNYRIEKKGEIRVVGAKLKTTMDMDKAQVEIPKFWGEMKANGMVEKMIGLMNQEPFGLLGMSVTTQDKQEFDYYMGVSTDRDILEGMEEYIIPSAQWAIFECVGPVPEAIQQLQKRIFTEWLPSSGYEYANLPDLEVYGDGDISSKDYKCQVWLPIVKK